MGRSVDYLTGAETVAYFNVGGHGYDQQVTPKEFSPLLKEVDWEAFEDYLVDTLQERFKSLAVCDDTWEGNEIQIILQNNFVQVGLSEYYGLASLSVRTHPHTKYTRLGGIAQHYCERVAKVIDELNEFDKDDSMSFGAGMFIHNDVWDGKQYHLRVKPIVGAPLYWLITAKSQEQAVHWAHEQTRYGCYITVVPPKHFTTEPDRKALVC